MPKARKTTLKQGKSPPLAPVIVPRDKHCISRNNISAAALKVLYRLHHAGFAAYLVGGSVRDLLLNIIPKDFDIATDAHPEQVKELFSNCILIGRRFRLAHVRFGNEIIEVATFRADHSKGSNEEARTRDNMIIRDNVYGTIEEDARRRDFTVNALYYNIADFSVVDFCHGFHDLQYKMLKILGNPEQRYQEDPVRMLRAVRFAAKLDFTLEKETAASIKPLAPLLNLVAPARVFEEILKLLLKGHAETTYELLRQHELFKQLFPLTDACLTHNQEKSADEPYVSPVAEFLSLGMRNTDSRIAQQKSVTPAFIFAVILWYPVMREYALEHERGLNEHLAFDSAIQHVMSSQQQVTTIPRRFTQVMTEIWHLQPRLERRLSRSVFKLLAHPRFRAAYDFLLLRAEAGEPLEDIGEWWTVFQEADEQTRARMQKELMSDGASPRRKRRRKRPT